MRVKVTVSPSSQLLDLGEPKLGSRTEEVLLISLIITRTCWPCIFKIRGRISQRIRHCDFWSSRLPGGVWCLVWWRGGGSIEKREH
jgi:hypothetical protein